MAPKRFGNVRLLDSGRFQARYRPRNGAHVNAPETFDTQAEAEAWLDDLKQQLDEEANARRRHPGYERLEGFLS